MAKWFSATNKLKKNDSKTVYVTLFCELSSGIVSEDK